MNFEYFRYITLKCQLLKKKVGIEKIKNRIEAHLQLVCGHFCPSSIKFSSKFSPHFGEKTFLWALGGPHHHFSLSPSLPNTFQEVFFPYFLSFFFILPKIHSTKHTLKLQCSFLKLFFVNLIITTMRTSGFHFQKHALRF